MDNLLQRAFELPLITMAGLAVLFMSLTWWTQARSSGKNQQAAMMQNQQWINLITAQQTEFNSILKDTNKRHETSLSAVRDGIVANTKALQTFAEAITKSISELEDSLITLTEQNARHHTESEKARQGINNGLNELTSEMKAMTNEISALRTSLQSRHTLDTTMEAKLNLTISQLQQITNQLMDIKTNEEPKSNMSVVVATTGDPTKPLSKVKENDHAS